MSRYNYFAETVVNNAAFTTVETTRFGFVSEGFSFLNRGAALLEYSFDGVTLHGDLDPADASKGLVFDSRSECRVWFRAPAGASTVRIEAWGGFGRDP